MHQNILKKPMSNINRTNTSSEANFIFQINMGIKSRLKNRPKGVRKNRYYF